ncbi:MAG: disulfide bond formation protein B [Nanoarchaeota archaeon]
MALEQFLNKFLGLGTLVLHIILGLSLIIWIYHKSLKKTGKRLPNFIYNIRNFISSNSILFAFILTIGATIGSLIYSDIIGLPPCDLCWYQRALIYPQVIILLVALIKKNKEVFDYVMGLNVIGIIISGYQYVMQMINYSGPCPIGSGGISCFAKDVFEFGYITIPLMSLTIFVVVIVLTWMAKHEKREE